MPINFVTLLRGNSGLKKSSYDVRMTDGTTYRRVELLINRDDDPDAYASENLDALWNSDRAVDVSAEWFVAARERVFADYYKTIQLAVQSTMASGGTLAQMNAAGEQVIATSPTKQGEWQAYKTTLGATSDFEIHTAMMLFSIIGRQAAGS